MLAVLSAGPRPTLAQDAPKAAATEAGGQHDFDFEVGTWRVHHRVKRPGTGDNWQKMEGTCVNRSLMDGQANVEEHRFQRPSGVTYGVAFRAYDPETRLWAIWWVDQRVPHGPVDPPVKGRFENGVGEFFSDTLVDGKTIRTRFIWSHITATSARWEQANSEDGGKTWETNWVMEFERAS